jgi:hypothetical protein
VTELDGAFAAVVVTGFGLLVTLVNGRADRRHTRQLAQDERLFAKRGEVYVDLLMYGTRTMLKAMHTWPDFEPVPASKPPETIFSPLEELRLEARIAAFASSEVKDAVKEFGQRRRAFFDYASEADADKERDPGAIPDRAKLRHLRDELTEIMRAELTTARAGRRKRAWRLRRHNSAG